MRCSGRSGCCLPSGVLRFACRLYPHPLQKLPHLRMTDLKTLTLQLGGQGPRALAGRSQRRPPVAWRHRLEESFQRSSTPAIPPALLAGQLPVFADGPWERVRHLEFPNAVAYGAIRYTRGLGNSGDPTPAKGNRLGRGPATAFICTREKCQETLKLIRDIAKQVPHYWPPNACQKWTFDFEQKLGMKLQNNPCVKENNIEAFHWWLPWAGHAAYYITLPDGSKWYVDYGWTGIGDCTHVGIDPPPWIW